mgnify:CR=1 FL=1
MGDLSCADQLSLKNVDLGYTSMFDERSGFVYLTAGSECWREIIDGIHAAADLVQEQAALLMTDEQRDLLAALTGDAEGASEMLSMADQMINMIDDYTDGEMLVSGWTWDAEAVLPGEEAGVCVSQGSDASCWVWQMEESGLYSSQVRSYIVDPASITADTGLLSETQTDLTNPMTPAIFGGWLCTPPRELMDQRVTSVCLRLLPGTKEDAEETTEEQPAPEDAEASTATNGEAEANGEDSMVNPLEKDPMFVPGPVDVTTYLSSRKTRPAPEPNTMNGNTMLNLQSRSFENFTLNLSDEMGMDNAFSGFASSLFAVAFGIAAVLF